MRLTNPSKGLVLFLLCLVPAVLGIAQVTPEEAAALKTTLTPMGAEKAGNKEGTIPAWTGGYTSAAGFVNGGRRPDPFASDKMLFSITAQNMDKYADKLSEGNKTMLKKHPQTYHIDVYPTRRTHANPKWIYDNIFKNATHVKTVINEFGPHPTDAYSGIPYPIPKTGEQVMWNSILRWQGTTFEILSHQYQVTADGRRVLLNVVDGVEEWPFYFNEVPPEKKGAVMTMAHTYNLGPPIRAGEGFMIHQSFDAAHEEAWVYLTGQRRTRKLPNPCCDTPAPQVAGIMGLDDTRVWTGSHLERFNWKLLGKKEMLVPYNCNGVWVPNKDDTVLMEHHFNPRYVRYELHRVWVVEATLKSGFRHQAARSVYYVDEDSWVALLGDRYDASGRIWKMNFIFPMIAPDLPGTLAFAGGFYDFNSGAWAPAFMANEMSYQYKQIPRLPPADYSPASLASSGIR